MRQRDSDAETRVTGLDPLHVTVLPEPQASVVGLAFATPVGLILLLLAVRMLDRGSDLEAVAVLAGIVVVMLIVSSVTARLICGEKLTIDPTGLLLVARGRRIIMRWDRPLQAHRWRTGFIGMSRSLWGSYYEALELVQAGAKIILWRESSYSQVEHLPRKASKGFRVPGVRNGRMVFEQIAQRGDLQWRQLA